MSESSNDLDCPVCIQSKLAMHALKCKLRGPAETGNVECVCEHKAASSCYSKPIGSDCMVKTSQSKDITVACTNTNSTQNKIKFQI